MGRAPQPEWMSRVRVGSVIRERSGVLRIVRKLSRFDNGDLRNVYLTIRRCSWTGRCYTVCGYTDLRLRGVTLLPVVVKLNDEFDARIAAAMDQPGGQPYILRCCDVIGGAA